MRWAWAAMRTRWRSEEGGGGFGRAFGCFIFWGVYGNWRASAGEFAGCDISGRHATSRHPLCAQQWGIWEEIPAGDARAWRRVYRLRQRWVAGYFFGEWDGLAGARQQTLGAETVSQQPRRDVYGRDAQGGAGCRGDVWD